MPRLLRNALKIAGWVAAAVALGVLALYLPATRSILLDIALRALVATRGLHVVHGSVAYADQELAIRDLHIDDDRGEEFFAVRIALVQIDPAGLFKKGGPAFGVRGVSLSQPTIFLRHRADGSWNFGPLVPHHQGGAPNAPPQSRAAQAWRLRVSVVNGSIDVLDPQAVSPTARALSLDGIACDMSIAQYATSTGHVRGMLHTALGSASVKGSLFEDDRLGFARATLAADSVPMAPLVDAFVPTRAFIVQAGLANLQLTAYAIGYAPDEPPAWHLSGDATVRNARLHITPLVVPIRNVATDLHFNDGLLSMKLARGDAAGIPLRAFGAVQLEGSVRLAIGVSQTGALDRAKALFAFSEQQDIAGSYSTAVRVDGPPSDLHVSGLVESRGARYQSVAFPAVQGSLYYADEHLTVGARDLAATNARVWTLVDFDLAATPLALQGIAVLKAPALDIPIAGNIMPGGTAAAIASIVGPALGPQGLGYAELTDAAGDSVRTFFGSGRDGLAIGPLLYRQGGGEALAWARRSLPSATWSGSLVATKLPLRVRAGRLAIADVMGPSVSLPSLDTSLDGEAFAFAGDGAGAPQPIAIDLRANSTVYDGVDVGRVELTAAGDANAVRVGRLIVSGPAMQASARGSVALGRSLYPTSAVLAGRADADLGAFAGALPSMRLRGSTSGDFAAAYDGTSWVGSLNASSSDATVAGIPLRGTSAYIDASHTATSLLGEVMMPAGGVWAFGTLSSQTAAVTPHVDAFVPNLDLSTLGALGLRNATGDATGFATIAGEGGAASVSAAAVVHGSYQKVQYAGDVDVIYGSGTLRSNHSRVALLGNQVTVSGVMSQLAAGSLRDAKLALSVRVRDGDLYALNRFTGKDAPITGSYDADAQIAGDLAQPTIDARLDTDIGTIRGVAFNELHGAVRVRPNLVQLSGGTVELGTSAFSLNANATPHTFSVRASSPHVDMTDFNDFFGGKDVFAGTGAFDVAVSSVQHHLLASGDASLDDAALYDYPLGRIQTTFSSSRRGGLHAAVTQSGPGGSMRIAGTVGFHIYHGAVPDFTTAAYRLRGRLRDLQVDEVLSLIHQEGLGLSGLLDADGSMRGTLQQPLGSATFQLRDGYLKRIQIKDFSATIASDENGVTLQNGALELPFLTAIGSGRFGFSGRTIEGGVTLQGVDLAGLAEALRLPGSLRGTALGRLSVSGSISHPKATADVDASHTSFYDVAFDEAKLHAQYAPGEVSIGDTTLTFAGKGGRVNITGTLPVQLHPLALGPKEKPVDFAMSVQGMDLSVLDPISKRYATLTGKLDAQATVSGTAGNPLGKGTATIADASVQSPLETVALTGVNAKLDFANETITLDRLHGTIGSGSIDMKGAAHVVPAAGLRTYAGLQLWSKLALHDAQVNVPNWISGTLDGGLSFTRSGSVPYVAGTINASNAIIPFAAIAALASGGALKAPPAGPVPGVPALLPGHTIVYGGSIFGPDTHTLTTIGQPTPAPTGFTLPSVDLDVALNANNNVRIRGGSSIDLTTTGGIIITSNLQSPTLQGQFQAIRGQVGYFDTTFRVVSGTVTFDPTSGLLPTLNAVAVTNVSGAQITLTVSGRVDNLNTDLESNPSMSRDQIIATLLHAPTVAALTSANPNEAQATIVQTAQSYFNAQLTRSLLYPVESALAQQLNIESISLIFNQYGQLALEVRTRFSNSVSAVYQSTVGAPVATAYGMSYSLHDYLALDVLQTSRPDYGLYSTVFNLRYTFP
ncbi:MAG TPA: translocation/assembly module TamB domain-containing protein [Candidatus Acidoferrales bacterium]|nr:translocation/assembly module TamB domain-containing protein [Candidatus Acidoferrales bacterium]